MSRKINYSAIVASAGVGIAFDQIAAASLRSNVSNGGAAALMVGMGAVGVGFAVYGKSEVSKAIGYGAIGAMGDSLATVYTLIS